MLSVTAELVQYVKVLLKLYITQIYTYDIPGAEWTGYLGSRSLLVDLTLI